MKIDLHTHTTISDGKLSPKELIDLAISKNLKIIGITDHDTVAGLKEAVDYSQGKGIEIVPGIEISCYEGEKGYNEVHILGLFIDYNNQEILNLTKKISEDRIKQKKKIIEKLQKLGFEIKFSELSNINNFSIGRPHIARILVKKYPEKFKTVKDVFDNYIGFGKPAYVEREYKIQMKEAIKIIKEAKGISIIAHPFQFNKKDAISLIDYFKSLGGQGVEAYYPYDKNFKIEKVISDEKIKDCVKITKEKNMIMSGGGDFHDNEKGADIGEYGLNQEEFDLLKKNEEKHNINYN